MEYLTPVWIWVHRFPNRIPEYMARVSIEPMSTDNLDSNGIPVVPKTQVIYSFIGMAQEVWSPRLINRRSHLAKFPLMDVKKWLGCGVLK